MKYLKLGVSRTQGTDVYMAVPDDFNEHDFFCKKQKEVVKAAFETTEEYDWTLDGDWHHNIEVLSIECVNEEEAKQFEVYEMKETP